jgi:D-threo-aldose 1-dehydrogenase
MLRRPLGQTGLSVTSLCVGTSALGSFPEQYGYAVTEDQAIETIERALQGPLNFIDTSNEYGNGGDSERRIGMALRKIPLPSDYVLATKVDPVVGSLDFSATRVRRSVEESLQRLGQNVLQLVYFHDPEKITFDEGMAKDGPVQELARMQHEGLIRHIGVAGGPIDLMMKYLETGLFEVVLSHNRYTLIDQSALDLIKEAKKGARDSSMRLRLEEESWSREQKGNQNIATRRRAKISSNE